MNTSLLRIHATSLLLTGTILSLALVGLPQGKLDSASAAETTTTPGAAQSAPQQQQSRRFRKCPDHQVSPVTWVMDIQARKGAGLTCAGLRKLARSEYDETPSGLINGKELFSYQEPVMKRHPKFHVIEGTRYSWTLRPGDHYRPSERVARFTIAMLVDFG